MRDLANELRDRGVIDEREALIDATFARAKGGGDEIDETLRGQGVETIAPQRSNRKLKPQDGRRLRRYERRWLMGRFFAWLHWKRR